MSGNWEAEKQEVASTARDMSNLDLVSGTSGNVSKRLTSLDESRDLLAITPSCVRYDTLTDRDIAITDFEIQSVEGDQPPSSEALLHVAIYRSRSDVRAVIHTHSIFSTVVAVSGLDIPPIIDEAMVAIGGPVQVSKYAFPGTQELADNVANALGERGAVLIRNHGAVGVGRNLHEALEICALVERLAQIFVYTSMLGKVNILPPHAIDAGIAIYHMRQHNTG